MVSEAPDRILTPQPYTWGTGSSLVGFTGIYQPTRFNPSSLQRIGVGSSLDRSGRQGVDTLVFDDFSGGFLIKSQYGNFGRDKNHYYINQGYITHIPGVMALSYENVTNTSIQSVDASGYRAANKRVHSAMFNGIWVGFIDTQMFLSTSTTNQVLTKPATADGVTEKVTAVAVVVANGTRYLVKCGAATDDIEGTTDPTQATVSWTKIVTLTDTPYINGIAHFPHIGPGVNILRGRPSTADGAGHFFFKQTATLPATLTAAVLEATKDIPGSIANITGASIDLAAEGVDNDGVAEAGWLVASGGTITQQTANAAASTRFGTGRFGNGAFSASYPKGRRVVGLALTLAHVQGVATDDIYPVFVRVKAGGQTSINLADGVELSTSGTDVYGGNSVTGGLDITTDDLDELIIEASYIVKSTGATANLTFSDVDVTVTYATDGTNPAVGLGGFSIGPMPAAPSTVVDVEPVADDLTAITVARRPVYYTYDWDSGTERVVLTNVQYPAVGEPYTGIAAHYLGGVAMACGPSESLFNKVKLAVSPSDVRNLSFPGIHGTKAQTITRMQAQGDALLVEVADTDGANAQLWIYQDQAWNAYGVMQSIESAIAAEPILWAETTLNTRLGYSYRFFPHSTTDLRSATEYVQPDINADPHVFNTTKLKTDGNPYLQTLILDGGAPEAIKTLLTLEMQTAYLDDDTAYGSCGVKVNTARDPAFTSNAVSMTFGGGTGETPGFTKYNVVNTTTYTPGAVFKTLQMRFTADHTSASDNTPNCLPLVMEFVGDWPDEEEVRIVVRPEQQDRNLVEIVEQLKTLKKAGIVQRLLGGHFNHPAVFEDAQLKYAATVGTNLPTNDQIDECVLIFRITPGSVTTNGTVA